jgi:hypothetical protein
VNPWLKLLANLSTTCLSGDRRFSPWKGSVVDSVVGVFLTQNVADHLSRYDIHILRPISEIKNDGELIDLLYKLSL